MTLFAMMSGTVLGLLTMLPGPYASLYQPSVELRGWAAAMSLTTTSTVGMCRVGGTWALMGGGVALVM